MNWLDYARTYITKNEGRENKVYIDTAGKMTGGIGHNFTDVKLSDTVIELLFQEDMKAAKKECWKYNWFELLDEYRKIVVIDMMFNLGSKKFASFKNMVRALSIQEYDYAAVELKDSKYFKQVKNRGWKNYYMMKFGEYWCQHYTEFEKERNEDIGRWQ